MVAQIRPIHRRVYLAVATGLAILGGVGLTQVAPPQAANAACGSFSPLVRPSPGHLSSLSNCAGQGQLFKVQINGVVTIVQLKAGATLYADDRNAFVIAVYPWGGK